MGQVISHYARLSGLKAGELAYLLTQLGWKVGERRVEQLLSHDNIADPQQISRRKLLAQVLAIPPILLGIAHVGDLASAAPLPVVPVLPGARAALDADTIARYESALATYWDSFYSSSVQRHAGSIERWCAHLQDVVTDAGGAERTHALTLLCRFEQLAAVAARDRTDYPLATQHHDQAITLAEELNNAELLAASLLRRARTLTHQQQVNAAVADLNRALPYARRSRSQLRGYAFQMAAEVLSRLPPTSERALHYQRLMDETGRILRKGPLEDDGSFTRLTLAGYHQDRARGFIRLGDAEAAVEAIGLAEKAHQPDMTRWQAELTVLRAQAFASAGEIDWACSELEEALRFVAVTHSATKHQKLVHVHHTLAQQHPTHPAVRRVGLLIQESSRRR
jgi:hypothetical protein